LRVITNIAYTSGVSRSSRLDGKKFSVKGGCQETVAIYRLRFVNVDVYELFWHRFGFISDLKVIKRLSVFVYFILFNNSSYV